VRLIQSTVAQTVPETPAPEDNLISRTEILRLDFRSYLVSGGYASRTTRAGGPLLQRLEGRDRSACLPRGPLAFPRPPCRRWIESGNLGRSERDQMAALVGVASNLRAILAAHVPLQFVDRRCLWPPNVGNTFIDDGLKN
jgi:hypothetical protein